MSERPGDAEALGGDGVGQQSEPLSPAAKISSSRLTTLVGEDFDAMASIGGVRGLIESTAPGLIFVVVFVVTGQRMMPALLAALGAALVATIVRLIQRTPLTQALSGLLGVGVGVVWALVTGRARDYFAGGLWANGAFVAVFVASIAVRWPLVGVIAGLLRSEGHAWRDNRPEYRKAVILTWVWVAMFAARLAVQIPLYAAGDVPWLGTVKLVMGLPLFALVAYISWLVLRSPKRPPAQDDPPES